jgi:flagellar protein FlgJ
LREVARQFEALFLQQMLKSMREASAGEGLMDNDQSRMYQGMYDQQIGIELSKGNGLGLAETLMQQLGGRFPEGEGRAPGAAETEGHAVPGIAQHGNGTSQPAHPAFIAARAAPTMDTETTQGIGNSVSAVDAGWDSPRDFVQALWPHAQRAADTLGTRPEVLIAQAALETGWGRAMPRHEDGRPSHNLFGIKADARWDGERVAVPTMEFRDGVMQRERAAFRGYDSLATGFEDYVNFLRENPRYQQALEAAGDGTRYVRELQNAGYATDPDYADKIDAILGGERLASALEVSRG